MSEYFRFILVIILLVIVGLVHPIVADNRICGTRSAYPPYMCTKLNHSKLLNAILFQLSPDRIRRKAKVRAGVLLLNVPNASLQSLQ